MAVVAGSMASRKHRGGGRRGGGAYLSARGAAAPAPASLTPSSLAWGGAAGPIRSGRGAVVRAGLGSPLPDGVQPPGARQVYRARKNTKREKPGTALSTTR